MSSENKEPDDVQKAIAAILAEFERQRAPEPEGKGYTEENDDRYADGELARAAATYALLSCDLCPDAENLWPWACSEPRPEDPIRLLEKAGALIVAELTRLMRKERQL